MKLLNRIEKIEAALRESSAGAVLLREPAPDADGAEWKRFSGNVLAAQEAGQRVIIRASGAPSFRHVPGAEYYGDDFAALLALLAGSPATDGRSSDRLSQVIREVQGTSLPVVHEVSNDGEV